MVDKRILYAVIVVLSVFIATNLIANFLPNQINQNPTIGGIIDQNTPTASLSASSLNNPSFEGKTTQVNSNNTNFEDWDIYRTPDNGIIKTWLESSNVHSGKQAFHWRTEAPNPTSLSLSFFSNASKKIPIDETKYLEAGYWSFVISGDVGSDITFYFYSENGTLLGRFWGQDSFGGFALNQWKRVSYLWYPSSMGSGNGYIPKGAKYVRLNIYENWHMSGVRERIDDDVFANQYDHYPTFIERIGWDLNNVNLSVDFSNQIGTSILSYSAHPDGFYDKDFLTGGQNQQLWTILQQFNFSKMRFQSGNPFCVSWNVTSNTCSISNIGFYNMVISNMPDNGTIRFSVETSNVHSGKQAFHHYIQAPSPTNLSFSYKTDYISIDETKYYEAGFWSYPIQGTRDFDVTLYFFDANKNFLVRLWGRDSINNLKQNSWNRTSSLWYPSSLGSGNGYIPKGAKYVQLQIFINWHTAGTFEAIDDDIFVRAYNSLPTATNRNSATATNLVANPSFENSYTGYNWATYDQMIEATKKVSSDLIIALPVGNWSNANYLPYGMPLNTSIYIEQWTFNKGFYPTMDSYCNFVKDIVRHTNIEKGYNVKYWEIGNEPPVDINEATTMAYIDLFNTAERCIHQVDPTALIGTDRSDFPDFMKNYFVKYANNVGFLDFHNYDISGTSMWPANSSNVNNTYYPPNDMNSWMKDETIMMNIQPRGGNRLSPKEAIDLWKQSRGQNLEMFATELNMNSAWRNGSDPRMNNLLGAVWYADKTKAYILDGGASTLTYFVTDSWDTNQPTSKYGGFGFGMMNSSYPYNPYAPYWTEYLLTRYLPKGSAIFDSKSTYPDLIDVLGVKAGNSYNILLVNKMDQRVSFNLSISGIDVKDVKLYLLDNSTYLQKYDPSIDNTIIYYSGISTVQLPAQNVQSLTFNGYTVAVMQISQAGVTTNTQTSSQTSTPPGSSSPGGAPTSGGGTTSETTTTTATETVSTTESTTGTLYTTQVPVEFNPGSSGTISIDIDNKTFEFQASNELESLFGVQTNTTVDFADAGKIAYQNANYSVINKAKLEYLNDKEVYSVEGLARDKFYGFGVDNLRIVTISAYDGHVISMNKELLFFSFFRTIFENITSFWSH